MNKITGSFIGLVLLIIFTSIVYIWQAESEKKSLEAQITSQAATIERLQQKDTQNSQENTGEISGVVTNTGKITGLVSFVQSITTEEFVVCARDVRSSQEYCGTPNKSDTPNQYSYVLDIPVGRYEVFATILDTSVTQSTDSAVAPDTVETYYSDYTVCNELGECVSDSSKKRLIEIIPNETQTDINIAL